LGEVMAHGGRPGTIGVGNGSGNSWREYG